MVRVGVRSWGGDGIDVLGAFAESSVQEGPGRGDAVVGGGLFAVALGDFVEHVDDFAPVVGFFEYGVGEIEEPDLMGAVGLLWS